MRKTLLGPNLTENLLRFDDDPLALKEAIKQRRNRKPILRHHRYLCGNQISKI